MGERQAAVDSFLFGDKKEGHPGEMPFPRQPAIPPAAIQPKRKNKNGENLPALSVLYNLNENITD